MVHGEQPLATSPLIYQVARVRAGWTCPFATGKTQERIMFLHNVQQLHAANAIE